MKRKGLLEEILFKLQWMSGVVVTSLSAAGRPRLVFSGVAQRWKVKGRDGSGGWTGSKERTVSINSVRREQTRSKNERQVGEDCSGFWGEERNGQGLKLSTRTRRPQV